MQRGYYELTSESVAAGHPDKLCDQISDAILDELLSKDPMARVACETFATTSLIVVGGEITTNTYVEPKDIVTNVLKDVGYTESRFGITPETCAVLNAIGRQSPDIAQGVDTGGAGDQGMMLGYACRETNELMPLPIMLAHKLMRKLHDVRKKKILPYLGPDGKAQVTVAYLDGHPVRITNLVLSTQHSEEILGKNKKFITDKAKKEIIDTVIRPVVGSRLIDNKTKILINPTGKFVIGGPVGDTGMTGRKIVVDTYGGIIPHGGGAFSGKDPTKVDRSATYMARYVAKNIVASGIADKASVGIAYAIGVAEPVSVSIDLHGTSENGWVEDRLKKEVPKIFSLTPQGIIKHLKLRRPIYRATAAYGHFGRNEFPWEKTDKAKEIKALCNTK
ncbi:methionine adenosyltransferase [Elusimicrobiota bacterium]